MDVLGRHAALNKEADREFQRNRRRQRGRMRCRAGCDACCHRLFSITEVEAAAISRFVSQQPASMTEKLQERSRNYLDERRALLSAEGYVESWGALPKDSQRLACPALENGRCLLYEARPRSCRLYGAPLVHLSQPGRAFACELNFPPGERLDDDRLVPLQTAAEENWQRFQEDYDQAGGQRFDEPVTVAHAIVEDFQRLLPK